MENEKKFTAEELKEKLGLGGEIVGVDLSYKEEVMDGVVFKIKDEKDTPKEKKEEKDPEKKDKEGKVSETGDIGLKQDYLSAVKDIAALELHLQRTIAKTKNIDIVKVLCEVRKERAKHQLALIDGKRLEGELWCACKHAALAARQLAEVGDKYTSQGDDKKALAMYESALDFDGIFNLLIKLGKNGNASKPDG